MQPWLLDHLRCPETGAALEIVSETAREGDHLMVGTLRAVGHDDITYEVIHGVPDLRPRAMRQGESQTLDVFGSEWQRFADWGWIDDPGPTREDALAHESGLTADSVSTFLLKTGHQALDETPKMGALAVDCGCGNGRFSREAAKYADRVIAIDASEASFVAFRNMREQGIDTVGVVRGSALDVPLADGVADHPFSIGVLQHTGNAPRMVQEMTRIARPGGRLSLNCYGTGTRAYEFVDGLVRRYTTGLDHGAKMNFAERISSWDRKMLLGNKLQRKLEKRLRRIMVLRPTLVQMFDWYAPETAEHYSPDDLRKLFADNGLEVLGASYPVTDPDYRDWPRKRIGGAYSFLFKTPG